MKRFPQWLLLNILLMICLCLPALVQAQPQNEDCHTVNDPFADCPIDGGLTALLAVGVAYGIKKYKDAGKSTEASPNK